MVYTSENPASGSFIFFLFPLKQQTCRAAETSLYHFILAICFHYIPSFISYFLWPVVTVLTQTIVLPLCHWFVFRGVSSLSVSLKHMTRENEYCILQMELSAPVSKVQESVWTTDAGAHQNPCLIPSQARENIPWEQLWVLLRAPANMTWANAE